ncbi:TetR/AcrR family transcriptional regulator [bacterium]|nr:TetR/AcrR family transcriptional regulator [bacterium]
MRRAVTNHRQDPQVLGSARERLLEAALTVLHERGYRGATSREIARVAQVNEVTLFRLFSTRDDLLAAALVQRAEADREVVPAPTGDLEADLLSLTKLAVEYLRGGDHLLIGVLPEVARMPEKQQKLVHQAFAGLQQAHAHLFGHYQDTGELTMEMGDSIWLAFMGPLLTAALRAEIRQEPLHVDPRTHVDLFLNGCAARRKR